MGAEYIIAGLLLISIGTTGWILTRAFKEYEDE